jgi:glycosyltransferase involved in cell wall biosynthesis
MPNHQVKSILMVHSRSAWGGNTAMVLALAQGLAAKGFRVGLVAYPDQPYIPMFKASNLPIHLLPLGGKKDLLAPLRLANLVIKEKYDLIHSHTRHADLAAVLAGRFSGRPVVITQHGNVNLDRKTLERRHDLFAFTYNIILRSAARVVAVCNGTRDELVRCSGVLPSKIRVIYNGLEAAELPTDSLRRAKRRELGIPEDAVVGIITCSIGWKGHDVLARATALLKQTFPQFMVLVAGTGPRERELAQQIEELGIADRFRLLGFRNDVRELLAAADIFVLPTRSETFSVAILEAMQAGLPVIASNICGVPEQVEDGVTGLLINPKDLDSVVDALSKLIGDEPRRRQMGEKGREKVREFTLERMVDGYIKLYKQVLGIR